MEQKQPNFNRPLLSVRRGSSSTMASPELYKKKSTQIQQYSPPPKLAGYKEVTKDSSLALSSRSQSEFVPPSLELASWAKAISVLQEREEETEDDLSSFEDEETDSLFLHCSVNEDCNTQNFTMGRFLSTDNAVASGTPQSFLGREVCGRSSISTKRTVYIDLEQIQESPSTNSSSPESRGRNPSVDYSLQDEKPISQPKCSETVFFGKDVKDNYSLLQEPKSPSESWLSRTIPKNPCSKPSARYNFFRASPMDSRQYRLLKMSIVKQHMLFRHPGDLVPILED